MNDKDILDLDIAGLTELMEAGRLTSVELVLLCLNRIAAYDRRGPMLNAMAVLNPSMFEEAAACDAERRAGRVRGALHGIPAVVKDSFKVAGLTVAAGSPAFADLLANEDAASVARLREAGAIIIGKTNMPPMAIGGGQRSLYGKTGSPYNPDYLAAAWHSGSSIGSGVAVAAGFAPVALAEETVSSGRSPASNNGLAAYTPSRGTISIRGNWPLFALRDCVVPYARTLADLALVIRELIRADAATAGDLWREQAQVKIGTARDAWPDDPAKALKAGGLRGKRIGVPKMYVGLDAAARTPIPVRASILTLWRQAEQQLIALGADVVHVDFPVVSQYEGDRDGARTLAGNGYVPESWDATEIGDLVSSCWKQFLRLNGERSETRLENTPPAMIHPDPPDAVDTRRRASAHEGRDEFRYDGIVEYARSSPGRPLDEFPALGAIMSGLERARKELFEDWLLHERLDLIVFPANCDISRADAETDQRASDHAWTNGTVFSNMNHVMRHLGIPSVSVPMGLMEDTAMPVNLTFCGPGWSDFKLLEAAFDYEQASGRRVPPPMTPALPFARPGPGSTSKDTGEQARVRIDATATLRRDGTVAIRGLAGAGGGGTASLSVFIDGVPAVTGTGAVEIDVILTRQQRGRTFSSLVTAAAYDDDGLVSAAFVELFYD